MFRSSPNETCTVERRQSVKGKFKWIQTRDAETGCLVLLSQSRGVETSLHSVLSCSTKERRRSKSLVPATTLTSGRTTRQELAPRGKHIDGTDETQNVKQSSDTTHDVGRFGPRTSIVTSHESFSLFSLNCLRSSQDLLRHFVVPEVRRVYLTFSPGRRFCCWTV